MCHFIFQFASTNDPLVTMMSSTGHEDITKHVSIKTDVKLKNIYILLNLWKSR